MPKITYVSHAGQSRTFDVPEGDSIMEGGVQNGIEEIVAACGGNCQCATCHVYVEEAWFSKLPPISDEEAAMLESTAAPHKPNSRLSCQLRVSAALDGIVVHTPEIQ